MSDATTRATARSPFDGPHHRRRRLPTGLMTAALAALLAALPGTARAEEVLAAKDNTMYSGSGTKSNGAGDHFFAGTTASGRTRRGLIAFDVAAAIPAGSTITAVTLQLHMSKTIAGSEPVRLHRVLADWGEGTSHAPDEEGGGAPATDGDATWLYRFYHAEDPPASPPWTTEGGDFAPTVSAERNVSDIGFYAFGSTPEMIADVQAWLDDPSSNFGWIVIGNEASSPTTKRFDTRTNPAEAYRPVLMIEYEAPPPCPADVNGDGVVDVLDLLAVLAAWGTSGGPEDVNGDGIVDVLDLLAVISAWGECP